MFLLHVMDIIILITRSVDDIVSSVQEFKVSSHNTMDKTVDHLDNLLTTVCQCTELCINFVTYYRIMIMKSWRKIC